MERGEELQQALKRELREELGVDDVRVDPKPLGVYRARAAFEPGMQVEIILYRTSIGANPEPRGEIEELVWYGPDGNRDWLSPIIKEHIFPDLVLRALI